MKEKGRKEREKEHFQNYVWVGETGRPSKGPGLPRWH